jgi:hypothetical protein
LRFGFAVFGRRILCLVCAQCFCLCRQFISMQDLGGNRFEGRRAAVSHVNLFSGNWAECHLELCIIIGQRY